MPRTSKPKGLPGQMNFELDFGSNFQPELRATGEPPKADELTSKVAEATTSRVALKPLLTIRSYAGFARFLVSGDLELDDEGMPVVVREIPAIPGIPSPYAFSSEWQVNRYKGREVVIKETSHKCYQVFAV